MSARGAIGGVGRPLPSVTDRVRGRRRAVLVWAVALCGVVLMCAFEPAAAAGVFRRHFRRQAGTSKAVQLLTPTIPTTYPAPSTTPAKPEPKKVKCYYFDTQPVRTYCHVLGLVGRIEAVEAEAECRAISMNMLSMNTTPEKRLCELMRLFGLEEHKLWLADVYDNLQPHSWEKCRLEVLNATSTTAPPNLSNCTICNIAVVCDAGFYHSNGPNCVTVDEPSGEVEYCYHKDRVSAPESTNRCLEHSARPLDVWELNGTLLEYVKPLVRTDLEFWVDLREEDVRNLSGVISFDTRNNDWNTSCVTVWFGRDVPWFFKRNCSDSFPIVCEDTFKKQYYSKNYRFPDCLYHRSHSWMFDYCIPEGHTYAMADGLEFCSNHSMSLLRGSTLDELFYVYTHVHGRPRQSYDRFLIWDARYSGSWAPTTNTCLATLLVETPPGKHPRRCSQNLGYICKQYKITAPTERINCEKVNWASAGRPDSCMSLFHWTYEDSMQFCDRLGMRLLPGGESATKYEEYLDKYEDSGEASLYWLGPELSSPRHHLEIPVNRISDTCVALQSPNPTIRIDGKNCSDRLRVVCLSSNGTAFPTSGPERKYSLPVSTNAITSPDHTAISQAIPLPESTQTSTILPTRPATIVLPTAAGTPDGGASLPSTLPKTHITAFTPPLSDHEHSQRPEAYDQMRLSTTPDFPTGWPPSVPGPACEYSDGWPQTAAGSTATRLCLGRNDKVMTRTCSKDGRWSETINSSLCLSEGYTECVEKIKSGNISGVTNGYREIKNRVKQADDVKDLTPTLDDTLNRFDNLANSLSEEERAKATLDLTSTIVDLAGVAMGNPRVWSAIPEDDKLRTAADLATKVESFVIKMIQYQPPNRGVLRVGGEKLVVVVQPVPEETLGDVVTLGNSSTTGVQLPPNFLPKGTKSASVIFSENSLVKDIFSCSTASSRQMSVNSRIPATSFLTASAVVEGKRAEKINGNVTLTFDYKCTGGVIKPSCSFIANSGNWSEEGCTLVEVTDDRIICSCNHLTVFAVLMSPRNISSSDIEALEWITKVGCGISIVCLTACIIIFTVYRQLRGIRNTIHRNLCLSLLIGEILLLAGMERNNQSRPSCMVVAFFLHFFFLAAFGWMALEGCHIIVLLWKVFNQKRTYYERYYLAGYGIPLMIAGITLACRHPYYAPKKENANNTSNDMMVDENSSTMEFCWLPAEMGVRYSFIGPVAVVIALNLGALCLVLWKMSHVRLVVEKSTAEKVQNWVRGTLILLPILGVTWLFGFLMLGNANTHRVGAYLFTIFNSLQGLGIFICHVFMSKKTREAIFRSVVSTGSMVKGSMSSRPSGSGSSSTKTTWYPISLSSNSTSHSSSSSKGIPSTDAKQPSQSLDPEGASCTSLQWWPGTRFRYNLRLNESGGARPPRRAALLSGSDSEDQPVLAKFRRTRSIAD